MKRLAVIAAILVLAAATTLLFAGCGSEKEAEEQAPAAAAPSGTYLGKTNDGVEEFLGIRYAAPAQRWKAPLDVTTTSEDEIDATKWGPCCTQPWDEVEIASQGELSEDCLKRTA